jgi:DNA-binding transcriptional LysR family regulator
MYDWDDIRHFIAVARFESLTVASQRLGVDAATVGRRIARLEASLKSTLFVRSRKGLHLTANGGRLFEAALAAEAAMEVVSLTGERDVVGGTVRLSVAEGFGTTVVAPALPSLRAAMPHVKIELAAQSGFLSSSKREVDIAVTLSAALTTRVDVTPLTDYELGAYASPAYLLKHDTINALDDFKRHEIVGYIDDLIYAPELNYLAEIGPGLRTTLSSSSIRAQREIIEAGGGVGVLPCFMSSGLTRVMPAQVRIKRRFWLSTHHDVTDVARVRAVVGWLRKLVKAKASKLLPPNL